MKNRITAIVVLISLLLLVFGTIKGIKIGDFKIASISELTEKNDVLEKKILEASNLTSIDYPKSTDLLEESYNKYLVQKQKYEQLVENEDGKGKKSYETKQYDIGYLWDVLGKYATTKKSDEDKGLELAIDVKKSTIDKDNYDFYFTITGTYVRISQFIVDIENDSDLNFRIYDFKMTGKEVKVEGEKDKKEIISVATFNVKNININTSTIKQ